MFNLFSKKEMNVKAAEAFWSWFAENEEWIITTSKTDGMKVVLAVDEKIKPVFSYFKKELEFQLGFNDEKGEFFFFHLGNKNLFRDGKTLGEMMPAELKKRWTYVLES